MTPALAAAGDERAVADKTTDELYQTLADPDSGDAGAAAEQEIQRRWLKSGSDTVDLLMSWAAQAVARKDFALALDYLDAVTTLKPDYAEGWNRRASLFYAQEQYGKALADLEKTLAIDPRHFGALAGLGMILRDIDHDREALVALKKAVALDPRLGDDVKSAVKSLEIEVDGRPI